MNNRYKITIQDPLLRPGIKIETEVSEWYVTKTIEKVVEMVREINDPSELAKIVSEGHSITHPDTSE